MKCDAGGKRYFAPKRIIVCFDVLQLPQHRFVQRPLNIRNPLIYYVNGSLHMFSGIMIEYIYRFLLETS